MRFHAEMGEYDPSMRMQRQVFVTNDVGGPDYGFEVFVSTDGRVWVMDSDHIGDEGTQFEWFDSHPPVWVAPWPRTK